MKRIIIATATFFLTLGCFAQDMIVKKDGSIIQAKVSEIGTTEVKYKKWSNQDGPLYAIAKSDILAINYQNGEKDTFGDNGSLPSNELNSQQGPQMIERHVAENNAELIANYNKNITIKEGGKPGKTIDSAIGIFGFTENSVLSNDDIEIAFRVTKSTSKAVKNDSPIIFRYAIVVYNKTNKPIHVDLANCSRMNKKTLEAYSFFDGETVSLSRGTSSAVGIGLFGVGIGLGTSSSTTKTYAQQRIVSVPPHGFQIIRDFRLEKKTYDRTDMVYRGEEFAFGYKANYGDYGEIGTEKSGIVKFGFNKNEIITYDVSNSPIVLDYSLVYSDKPDFSQYSTISASLYLRELIGIPVIGVTSLFKWMRSIKGCFVNELEGYDEYTICGPIKFD